MKTYLLYGPASLDVVVQVHSRTLDAGGNVVEIMPLGVAQVPVSIAQPGQQTHRQAPLFVILVWYQGDQYPAIKIGEQEIPPQKFTVNRLEN